MGCHFLLQQFLITQETKSGPPIKTLYSFFLSSINPYLHLIFFKHLLYSSTCTTIWRYIPKWSQVKTLLLTEQEFVVISCYMIVIRLHKVSCCCDLVSKLLYYFTTLWTVACRLLCPWDFPGKNTGVDCHFLLQGIFMTQGSNASLLHCRQLLYQLCHQGSILGSAD